MSCIRTPFGGYDGLLFLAEHVTRVSLSDMRQLHGTKYSLLHPLTRLVVFEVGPAIVRNQEMDPETHGLTICQMPDVAVMNFVVYCDLFHHYVDNILSSPVILKPPTTRGCYSTTIHRILPSRP